MSFFVSFSFALSSLGVLSLSSVAGVSPCSDGIQYDVQRLGSATPRYAEERAETARGAAYAMGGATLPTHTVGFENVSAVGCATQVIRTAATGVNRVGFCNVRAIPYLPRSLEKYLYLPDAYAGGEAR